MKQLQPDDQITAFGQNYTVISHKKTLVVRSGTRVLTCSPSKVTHVNGQPLSDPASPNPKPTTRP